VSYVINEEGAVFYDLLLFTNMFDTLINGVQCNMTKNKQNLYYSFINSLPLN